MTVYNKRHEGIPPDAFYVGRPTVWGNPYSHVNAANTIRVENRSAAVEQHEQWLRKQYALIPRLKELTGKDLVCWCAPLACHGNTLEYWANNYDLLVIDRFDGPYRFLSNFRYHTIVMYGQEYPSTEHAFQASKTLNLHDREMIRRAPTPKAAKSLGRKVELRDDWDEFRFFSMLELNRRKFQDRELGDRLLATGDKILIEGNYWDDTHWGVCLGCRKRPHTYPEGHNHLGRVLMQVRDELKG